ncbi:IS1380 family transposase [Tetragenococcus halophilus]|uniref:IS1380 family transposase n=2 Tax=Tetragenococcus halophilus TaxID=51669 RepID=UPI0005A0FA21|nr:IS1380 family transposase [Tetragenococcus halophilus]
MSFTLRQKPLTFNSQKNISIANAGGTLTNDVGMVLVAEFLKNIHFDSLLNQRVHIKDNRKFAYHSWHEVLKQWLYQLIAEYSRDRDANKAQYDRLFQEALQQENLSSQSILSTFLHTLTTENVSQLAQVAKDLADLWLDHDNTQHLVLDFDSTACPTYGEQEEAEFIYHYGIHTYPPFVAFEGVTGLALDVYHCHGKPYTSTHAEDYLEEMLDRYQQRSSDPLIMVRGDSGFAKPEIFAHCENRQVRYVIKLKSNARLLDLIQHQVLYQDDTDYTKTEQQYFLMDYRANKWRQSRRVAMKATRPAGSLFFTDFQFIVTNFENLDPKTIFQLYQKRGNMENFIKEMKGGFFAEKTDSTSFIANQARLALSFMAYNMIHLMKYLTFPSTEKATMIDTIRFKLFHLAGRMTEHARQVQIHLSNTNVYDTLFWDVLARIQRLNL